MKERPILFNTEMVRAILAGKKTQTRRIVKWKPRENCSDLNWHGYCVGFYNTDVPGSGYVLRSMSGSCWSDKTHPIHCPFGAVGDHLWVRESFMGWFKTSDGSLTHVAAYKADGYQLEPNERWIPSIHMPRKASRITLEITDIKIERMQDGGDREFWGEEQWALNPWVWVIEFKRVK